MFLCQFCHRLYLHPNQFQVLCGIFLFRIGEGMHIIQKIGIQIVHVFANSNQMRLHTLKIGSISEVFKLTDLQFKIKVSHFHLKYMGNIEKQGSFSQCFIHVF